MKLRKIMIIAIIVICALSLTYGLYYQIFEKKKKNTPNEPPKIVDVAEFEKVFDNNMNSQGYNINLINRIDASKDIVYTDYSAENIYESKYDIKVDIPAININSKKIEKINKEISKTFLDKAKSIVENAKNENVEYNIYTVEYTAYLNENILSLVIRQPVLSIAGRLLSMRTRTSSVRTISLQPRKLSRLRILRRP